VSMKYESEADLLHALWTRTLSTQVEVLRLSVFWHCHRMELSHKACSSEISNCIVDLETDIANLRKQVEPLLFPRTPE